MDESISSEEDQKRISSNKISIKMSSRERKFLIISDILIIGFITIDLLAFTDLIKVDMGLLSLANIVMVSFTYLYYRFKKKITVRAFREAEKNG